MRETTDTLGMVDELASQEAVDAHLSEWKHRRDQCSSEQLRTLDEQALGWQLLSAFSDHPELMAVEIRVDRSQEASRKEQRQSLDVTVYASTGSRYREDVQEALKAVRSTLVDALRAFGKHQPDAFELLLGDPVFKRINREEWGPSLGGEKWWAKCRGNLLEQAWDDGERPARPKPRF